MFDRVEIYDRFAECYLATYAELAAILGIARQTAHNWKVGRYPLPWTRLKTLVDDQCLSWDWLLEGKGPKHRRRSKRQSHQPFDRHAINQRFLSLFSELSQAKLGKELGVNGTTVFKWRHAMEQVSWERLKDAVDVKGVTWEWIIEGR